MISEDGKSASASSPAPSDNAAASTDPSLDRVIQARIGDRLRAMYDSLADEPVPDRLSEILKRLESGKGS